ncbi:MAG: hypothetical protein ACI8XO_004181 [Verrucomicrobiales bacterium]
MDLYLACWCGVISEVLQFLKRIWWHFLLLLPGCILVTVLHEAAHALVVILQGGEIVEFVVLPDGAHWGFVRYVFPDGQEYSELAVALAPYFMWIGFAACASVLGWLPIRWKFWSASMIFLWLFVVPLGDLGNAAFPWVFVGADNDFRAGLGEAGASAALGIVLLLGGAFYWGYILQRRLFREAALGWAGFGSLFGLVVVGLVLLTC